MVGISNQKLLISSLQFGVCSLEFLDNGSVFSVLGLTFNNQTGSSQPIAVGNVNVEIKCYWFKLKKMRSICQRALARKNGGRGLVYGWIASFFLDSFCFVFLIKEKNEVGFCQRHSYGRGNAPGIMSFFLGKKGRKNQGF